MNKVDLTLLLLACFELNHFGNTPEKVVINEAINIAKKFGTNNSSSFVNGVLNKLFKINNNN
jgi:N utilization substance protein B